MSQLKISIITPSFNQGEFIELAIQSVLDQHYSNFEHIILDNVSTDRTVEILKKYPHLIWRSQPDKGQSDALNQGFKMATGDIIGWLNTDELYLPGCFQTVVDSFTQYSDTDIFYGDYRWIDQRGVVLQQRREIDFDLFILKYLHICYIQTASTFFKKTVFDNDNYLDVSLRYAMDYEFFLRLALKGYRYRHISNYLADFRWHENNKSTLSLQEQQAEQENALFQQDSFLSSVASPIQPLVRNILKYLARGKRYILKTAKGYYLDQWQSSFF